jgi:hypothetical protein
VFESVLLREQSLWLVVAGFYVFDNLKQLPGNKLVFHEKWNLRWRASVPSDSLVFLNTQVAFLNILLPYTLALPVEWLTAEPYSPSRIRRADRFLRVCRRRILPLRCISAICFFAFFIEGPFLTYWRGLTYALLHMTPIYAAALAMLSIALVVDRRFWHLSAPQIIGTVFEAAICPAYLVNITHRMSWKHMRLDMDGGAYALLRFRSRFHDDLKSALNSALEGLEQKVVDDPEARERLFAYRESVLR